MKLNKEQINKIKKAHKNVEDLENKLSGAIGNLASIITDITNIEGNVDFLQGDGFGFTPRLNNNTHITIEKLIDLAEKGVDITEGEILNNLTI